MTAQSPAAELLSCATARGITVATGESLTAGLVAAMIADVPGASQVLHGGVIAYDPRVKVTLLGVNEKLLREGGTVQAGVAAQMAIGAARATGASCGLSTTGVAGPGPSEGKAAGTVYVAVAIGADSVNSGDSVNGAENANDGDSVNGAADDANDLDDAQCAGASALVARDAESAGYAAKDRLGREVGVDGSLIDSAYVVRVWHLNVPGERDVVRRLSADAVVRYAARALDSLTG